MRKRHMRKRQRISFEQSENTPDARTISPREDVNIASFSDYVSHVYTLRAQLVRDDLPLRSLSFRRLFNIYILTSLLYYRHDTSFIPDPLFDQLCEILVERREEAKTSIFWHGPLYDLSMLKAGSGFHLKMNNSPVYLQNAADMIASSKQAPWESVCSASPRSDAPADTPGRRRRRVAIDFKPKRRRAKL